MIEYHSTELFSVAASSFSPQKTHYIATVDPIQVVKMLAVIKEKRDTFKVEVSTEFLQRNSLLSHSWDLAFIMEFCLAVNQKPTVLLL